MGSSVVYSTSEFPPCLHDEKDLLIHQNLASENQIGIVNPNGTICSIVDLAPGLESAMHRTQSLDNTAVPQLATWYSQQDNGPLLTTDFWELCQKRAEYLSNYQEYWKSKHKTSSQRPVDGVIRPVGANVAAKEDSLTYFAYSAIVNFLDYSAGSFPVTKIDKNLDLKLPQKPLMQMIRPYGNCTKLKSLMEFLLACKSCVGDFRKRRLLELLDCITNVLSHLKLDERQ